MRVDKTYEELDEIDQRYWDARLDDTGFQRDSRSVWVYLEEALRDIEEGWTWISSFQGR